MDQHCKIVFSNISSGEMLERIFDSKNQAFTWLNHKLVRESSLRSCHELYFRIESAIDKSSVCEDPSLPF